MRVASRFRALQSTDVELDVDASAIDDASGVAVRGVNRLLGGASEAFVAVLDRHTLADFAIRSSNGGRAITPPSEASRSPPRELEPAVPRPRAGSLSVRQD